MGPEATSKRPVARSREMVFNESTPTGLHPEVRGLIPHVAVENRKLGSDLRTLAQRAGLARTLSGVKSGGAMDLRESKFYYAGHDINFAVFSDHPCRVRYVERIRLPIGETSVEVYGIEPGANSQWIVVQQRNDGKGSLKFFVRGGEIFRETHFTTCLSI
jgi:hypothetical protein